MYGGSGIGEFGHRDHGRWAGQIINISNSRISRAGIVKRCANGDPGTGDGYSRTEVVTNRPTGIVERRDRHRGCDASEVIYINSLATIRADHHASVGDAHSPSKVVRCAGITENGDRNTGRHACSIVNVSTARTGRFIASAAPASTCT